LKAKKRDAHAAGARVPSSAPPSGPARGSSKGVVLHQLAFALKYAAGIYNQGAPSKMSVEGPSASRPARLSLSIQSIGYRFEETEEGFLYVSEIGEGTQRAWARLEPQSDTSGHIVCWRERRLQEKSSATLRTSDGLSEEYLINLVRRRILAPR
jgi:hypothetical protein